MTGKPPMFSWSAGSGLTGYIRDALAAASLTVEAVKLGIPHFSQAATPVLSSTPIVPTMAKSAVQLVSTCGRESVSAESRLSRVILRPSMPPAALHQSVNAVALSHMGCRRPGAPGTLMSAMTDTSTLELVTPVAVAPVAEPGPHTAPRVPKEPDAVLPAWVVALLVEPLEFELE